MVKLGCVDTDDRTMHMCGCRKYTRLCVAIDWSSTPSLPVRGGILRASRLNAQCTLFGLTNVLAQPMLASAYSEAELQHKTHLRHII